MSLENYTTEELVNEVKRRAEANVVAAPNQREKLAFKCRTCGSIEYAGNGNFFADIRPFGAIWHHSCTRTSNKSKVGLMDHVQGAFNGVVK